MRKINIHSTVPAADLRIWLFLAGLAGLAVYYRLLLPFVLLSLYLFFLIWSYAWTGLNCYYVKAGYTIGGNRLFAGEKASLEISFKNHSPLPLARCGVKMLLPEGLIIAGHDEIIATGAYREEENVPAGIIMPFWRQHTVTYSRLSEKETHLQLDLLATRRGTYYLPAPWFFAGDPAGLFQGKVPAGKDCFLTVYPRLGMREEELLRGMVARENNKESRWGAEDPYRVQGIRDYELTDSPKHINWYASARTSSLKTNVYAREKSELCLLVLDLSTQSEPLFEKNEPGQEQPRLERAIGTAASIALACLEQGIQTAFCTNAPLVEWIAHEKKEQKQKKGLSGYLQRRKRGINYLSFAGGREQGREILRLTAAIDSSARATVPERRRMWHYLQQVPADTFIYIITYQTPPPGWHMSENVKLPDAADFYSSERMRELPTVRYKHLDMSSEEVQL